MLAILTERKMSLPLQTIKAVSDKLLIGKCVPCLRDKVAKIVVTVLELDTYVLHHFEKECTYYAHDPKQLCKPGDLVLIKKKKKINTTVTHDVIDIPYPAGDITDPVTGRKCIGAFSRDMLKEIQKKFGDLPSTFDYDKAPERGWQEGKRDATSLPVYTKYHKFNPDDEEHSDPYGV